MTLAKFGKWPEGEIGAQILRERGRERGRERARERVRERGRKGERERGERKIEQKTWSRLDFDCISANSARPRPINKQFAAEISWRVPH